MGKLNNSSEQIVHTARGLLRNYTKQEFESKALIVFRYQFENNLLYRAWCNLLGILPEKIDSIHKIPFLPAGFFRSHKVVSNNGHVQMEFKSSGTSNSNTAVHHVSDLKLYETSFLKCFKRFYGNVTGKIIIGLLPSYMERKESSLLYMCDILIRESSASESGFFLDQYDSLKKLLAKLRTENKKVWLIGVSYALLDFSTLSPPAWPNLTVVETGGMKGRKKEMVREELHQEIRKNWPVEQLHSEYGMTELMSQAYRTDSRGFRCPPWMKILVRDEYDPFQMVGQGKYGGINIIDLANIHSCSFIETQDIGIVKNNGFFEVLGRMDRSEARGCNMLIT